MNLTAVIISLLLLSGYFFMVYSYSKELFKTIFKFKNKIYSILYCIGLLIPGILIMFLFEDERYVYYWDFSGYWLKAIDFSHLFFENPLGAITHVYDSVRSDEYNVLPNLLLAPVNKLLGLKYNMYILSNYLVYFLPFALITANLIIKSSPSISKKSALAVPVFILFFTPGLIPIRYGFVDAIGLVYIAIILSMFVNSNYLRQLNIKQSVLLGFLLLLLIFSRRWYAFWFESFFVSAFITNALFAYKHKNKKAFINSTLNLTIAGVVAMGIMLTLFFPFFKMTVLKDYTDIYSAYRSMPPMRQLQLFSYFFGGFIILTAIAGMLLSFKKEKTLATFLIISTTLIVLHFTRVNDFGGYQHFYLLVPFFLIFFCKAIVYLDRNKFILPILFLFLLINNYFVVAINGDYDENAYVFCATNGKPKSRGDYDILMALSDKVTQLINNGSNVYCLASSNIPYSILNDDILKNTQLPDTHHPIFKLKLTQHVDKRDHFPNDLFTCNYVIVTNPPQTHLGADNQRLISYFNSEFLNGTVENHFVLEQKFKLGNNVTAFILKKVKAFTEAEIHVIRDYFKNAYPDYPEMYNTYSNAMKLQELTAGNGYAAINFLDNNNIEFIPGSERASRMTFQFDEKDTTLSFNATFKNKESLVHECNPDRDGEVYLTILENDIEIKKLYITHKQDVPVTLDVSGGKKITLIVDKGKNEDYCDWFHLTGFTVK